MTVGGVHSGRFGTINGIAAVRNWSINDEQSPATFVNSATAIGHGRAVGVNSWTGNYAKHGGLIDYFPGQTFSFTGYEEADTDILNGIGSTVSGTVIVDSVSITWDWASGQVLAHQVQFSGVGLPTYANGGTAILDATVGIAQPIGLCSIATSPDGTTQTVMTGITQATLNITAANASYVNSGTAGGTGRKAGIIDWQLAISIEESNLYQGLAKGNLFQLKLFTDATNFYLLKWGQLINSTGLVVNPENGAIISQTLNFGMAAVNPAYPTIPGRIILPGGSTPVWGS